MWERLHKFAGYGSLLLSVLVIYLGLRQLGVGGLSLGLQAIRDWGLCLPSRSLCLSPPHH